jgi:phosphoserine phosphatase RsbU/P
LTLAQDLQENLLPRFMPQFENYHIHVFNSPARSVGGNFYEFQQLNPQEWMGVLADVSCKGIPAALYSSLVLGALSMGFRSQIQPCDVLKAVNGILCEKSLPSQFVTLFLLRLTKDGAGKFVSAGHTPTFLFRSATGEIEVLNSDAYMLGMFEFATYRPREFHLDKGDVLVVYADGLTKAENPRGELFGEERLREVIEREARSGSRAVEQGIRKAVEEFTAGMPQPDDISLAVIEKYT